MPSAQRVRRREFGGGQVGLTVACIAFRAIPSGHDTDPGPRCAACRGRIEGPPARDDCQRAYHPGCLTGRRAER